MPPQENQPTSDEDLDGEILRKGAPVIKTTIEFDKNLYIQMKEEIARSNSSIRDFLTIAVKEKLIRRNLRLDEDSSSVGSIEQVLQRNNFMKKVLLVIQREVYPPFGLALLLSKLEDFDIAPEEFSPMDLSDEFIEKLITPVNALSGPAVTKELKAALVQLRRG